MSLKETEKHLDTLMQSIKDAVFPVYSDVSPEYAESMIIKTLESISSAKTALLFADALPEISRLVHTDVEAISKNDPAANDRQEIVYCYPAVTAMLHYRAAHVLHGLGIPVIPRMMTERAHSLTGIDIHPGARIGEYFAIDHGTGVVVGATTIIGNHVTLYQGVTLGAKNFSYSPEGLPMNIARHPVIEDNVTIYSGASILGRITIGAGSVIGGNVWLTHSVPPRSKVLQGKIQELDFIDGAGI